MGLFSFLIYIFIYFACLNNFTECRSSAGFSATEVRETTTKHQNSNTNKPRLIKVDINNKFDTDHIVYRYDKIRDAHSFVSVEPFLIHLVKRGDQVLWDSSDHGNKYCVGVFLGHDDTGKRIFRVFFPEATPEPDKSAKPDPSSQSDLPLQPKKKHIHADVDTELEFQHESLDPIVEPISVDVAIKASSKMVTYMWDPFEMGDVFIPRPGYAISRVTRRNKLLVRINPADYPDYMVYNKDEEGHRQIKLMFTDGFQVSPSEISLDVTRYHDKTLDSKQSPEQVLYDVKKMFHDIDYHFKPSVKCAEVKFGTASVWRKGEFAISLPKSVSYTVDSAQIVVRDRNRALVYQKKGRGDWMLVQDVHYDSASEYLKGFLFKPKPPKPRKSEPDYDVVSYTTTTHNHEPVAEKITRPIIEHDKTESHIESLAQRAMLAPRGRSPPRSASEDDFDHKAADHSKASYSVQECSYQQDDDRALEYHSEDEPNAVDYRSDDDAHVVEYHSDEDRNVVDYHSEDEANVVDYHSDGERNVVDYHSDHSEGDIRVIEYDSDHSHRDMKVLDYRSDHSDHSDRSDRSDRSEKGRQVLEYHTDVSDHEDHAAHSDSESDSDDSRRGPSARAYHSDREDLEERADRIDGISRLKRVVPSYQDVPIPTDSDDNAGSDVQSEKEQAEQEPPTLRSVQVLRPEKHRPQRLKQVTFDIDLVHSDRSDKAVHSDREASSEEGPEVPTDREDSAAESDREPKQEEHVPAKQERTELVDEVAAADVTDHAHKQAPAEPEKEVGAGHVDLSETADHSDTKEPGVSAVKPKDIVVEVIDLRRTTQPEQPAQPQPQPQPQPPAPREMAYPEDTDEEAKPPRQQRLYQHHYHEQQYASPRQYQYDQYPHRPRRQIVFRLPIDERTQRYDSLDYGRDYYYRQDRYRKPYDEPGRYGAPRHRMYGPHRPYGYRRPYDPYMRRHYEDHYVSFDEDDHYHARFGRDRRLHRPFREDRFRLGPRYPLYSDIPPRAHRIRHPRDRPGPFYERDRDYDRWRPRRRVHFEDEWERRQRHRAMGYDDRYDYERPSRLRRFAQTPRARPRGSIWPPETRCLDDLFHSAPTATSLPHHISVRDEPHSGRPPLPPLRPQNRRLPQG